MFKDYLLKSWWPVYDGDDDGNKDDNKDDNKDANNANNANNANKDGSFTQEQVNDILAKEKAKWKSKVKNLETFRDKANLSSKELDVLNQQIEEMRAEHMSQEELAKESLSKSNKKYIKDLEDITKERDTWKTNYTNTVIERSIVDAAFEHKAYSPEQVVAILRPNTRLVEIKDEDSKSTGNFEPKTTFETVDSDDKPITLELSPLEAVKRMLEIEKYANLFTSDATGGIGKFNKGKGKKGEADYKNVGSYIENRKKEKKKGTQ